MTEAAEPVADQVIRLGDGRTLGYCVWGDPGGRPLLFLHGTPGSRLQLSMTHARSRELGLALIAPDRWGYGLSDAPATPLLPAFAADMAALMDHLGHRRFAVGGVSGGGPYATAVAALLRDRVTALALISPVGPIADAGCLGALPPFQRFCFGTLPRLPSVITGVFGVFRWTIEHAPHLAAHLAILRGGRADKQVMATPHARARLLGSFREGLRPGMRGPVIDLAVFSRPWGVDPGLVSAPAHLWLGTADTAVPLIAARMLAARIPGCISAELEDEGHLWVAINYSRVLDWIMSIHGTEVAA